MGVFVFVSINNIDLFIFLFVRRLSCDVYDCEENYFCWIKIRCFIFKFCSKWVNLYVMLEYVKYVEKIVSYD